VTRNVPPYCGVLTYIGLMPNGSTLYVQSANQLHPLQRYGQGPKSVELGHVTLATPILRTVNHLKANTTWPTRVQNLKSLALAVPEIITSGVQNFKICHVTLNMPLSGMICHQRAGTCYDQAI